MWVHCSCLQTPQKRASGPFLHCRWLWATMWCLGIELRTSRKAVSALNRWAISPAPEWDCLKLTQTVGFFFFFLFLFFCFFFFETASHKCTPGCPQIHCVARRTGCSTSKRMCLCVCVCVCVCVFVHETSHAGYTGQKRHRGFHPHQERHSQISPITIRKINAAFLFHFWAWSPWPHMT